MRDITDNDVSEASSPDKKAEEWCKNILFRKKGKREWIFVLLCFFSLLVSRMRSSSSLFSVTASNNRWPIQSRV
jgi:hypothetical protein